MKERFLLITLIFLFSIQIKAQESKELEIVSKLDARPGNVAVSNDGRVFVTMHPFGNSNIQLIELRGKKGFRAFPSKDYQKNNGEVSDKKLDTPLGIKIDRHNRLWVIDMGLNIGKTRLFAFDIETKEEVFRYNFPQRIVPRNSFVQDLAIDDINGWVYLADAANAKIIALNIKNKIVRSFSDKTTKAENINMVIDGKVIYSRNSPLRIGVNPITLSADKSMLFYGAMNGTTWYGVPTKLFRNRTKMEDIKKAVQIIGTKPISDGAITDNVGNHYFTNIQEKGIDVLNRAGKLQSLYRDSRIDWPDNVALDNEGWLYISVNQLYKAPEFTGGKDEGEAPFYIYKIKL